MGIVKYICNPNIQVDKAGRSEFKIDLDYIARYSLQNNKKYKFCYMMKGRQLMLDFINI